MARPARYVPWVAALLLFTDCRKPEEDLGLDLLPGDPLGVVFETLVPRAYTFAAKPIRTSGLTRNLLGSYLDPGFGLVRAGIVAQLRLGSSNVGGNQNNSGLVADSMVLALAFDGANFAYGNLNEQVFRVFELSEGLSVDTVYETNDVPRTLPVDLAAVRGGRVRPEPMRRPNVGGDSLQPQLRIALDKGLAQRFLNAFGTADLSGNTAFLEFFKGIYITVDNGAQLPFQQGILYFNLLSSASKATVYYRDTLATDPDRTLTFDLLINASSVRYTVAEHDHSQALDPGLASALADTVSPARATYVQALGGLRTAIRFPGLMRFAERGLLLAKAELVLPLEGSFNPYLGPPAQLFIFRRGADGADAFLPDQTGGVVNIDGNYATGPREYRFNITRYVQGVLNGTIPDNGVELVPASNGVSANRAVLAGPAREENPMRLRLTFTSY